jgi:hypothetical protein
MQSDQTIVPSRRAYAFGPRTRTIRSPEIPAGDNMALDNRSPASDFTGYRHSSAT